MDNRKTPDPKTGNKADDRLLHEQDERHRNDRGAPPANGMPASQAPEPDLDVPPVARLVQESGDQAVGPDQLRDAEISLVDRIADVDDERRRATTRLQRAWQAHQDEVDVRLRRQGLQSVVALLLLTLVGAVVVFLAFDWLRGQQLTLAEELTTTKAELTQRPVVNTRSSGQDLRLDRLSAQVSELTAAVAELQAATRQSAPEDVQHTDKTGETNEKLATEIRQIEAMQRLAAQELDSLRDALDAATMADKVGTAGNRDDSDQARPEGGGMAASSPGSVPATAAPPHPIDKQMPDAATGDGADDRGSGPVIQKTGLRVTDRTFALQLISFHSIDTMSRFAGRDDLPAQIYSFEETVNGRPLYSVIHSLHASLDEAAEQISRLPAELVELSPWIRPVRQDTELEVLKTGAARAVPEAD